MSYDRLAQEAASIPVEVHEKAMVPTIKGLYGDRTIWINRNLTTKAEKSCVLAEELGHHHTSAGDILDQRDLRNRKQERRALVWAYQKLVPLDGFVLAYKAGIRNRYELADHFGITEDFLETAIRYYKETHGLFAPMGRYYIYFDPLSVLEMFE